MKMINDMDLYFADAYARKSSPVWMRAERIEFCDQEAGHKRTAFSHLLSRRKAN